MSSASNNSVDVTAQSYAELLVENARLKSRIRELEQNQRILQQNITQSNNITSDPNSNENSNKVNGETESKQSISNLPSIFSPAGLSSFSIFRYSRQLLLTELGLGPHVQLKFNESRVLCIGAGGLGADLTAQSGFTLIKSSSQHWLTLH